MKDRNLYFKIVVTAASFICGGFLVYLGLTLFLSPEQVDILISKPADFHFFTLLLVLPLFVFGGVQSFILFKRVYDKNLSLYDVITLPFVLGLWGFIVPFHGAYIYNSIYFKAKYKIAIVNTTSISLVSLSISFILAGIFGIAYSCFAYQNVYFLLLSIASLVHPLIAFIFLKIFDPSRMSGSPFIQNILVKLDTIFRDYLSALNVKNILILSVMNLLDSLAFAVWSLWISENFGFGLTFFQLLMLQFFMKITILFKFTPGNLGVNQFASSGIILLVGGNLADGFTLSLYQTAMGLIASFLVGSVCSLINFRYIFNKQAA